MALWDDLLSEIVALSNRPDLTVQGTISLRQAIRAAHSSGKYWKDLQTTTITNLDTTQVVQTLDLTVYAPRLRQVSYLHSADGTKEFHPIEIGDLTDPDGQWRTDVYYGFGTNLKVRACAPLDSYELAYWIYPLIAPTSSYVDWVADQHRDFLVTYGAAVMCGLVGEQEIKAKMESLAADELKFLMQSNVEVQGR